MESSSYGARSVRPREARDHESATGRHRRATPASGAPAPPFPAPWFVRTEGRRGHEPPAEAETPGGSTETCEPQTRPSGTTCCRGRASCSIYTRGASPHRGEQGERPVRPRPAPCGPALLPGRPLSGR